MEKEGYELRPEESKNFFPKFMEKERKKLTNLSKNGGKKREVRETGGGRGEVINS